MIEIFVLKLCDLSDFSLSGINVLIDLISVSLDSKVFGFFCKFS